MSTGSVAPFLPASATVALVASTTSASAPIAGCGGAVVFLNSSSSIAFVKLGAGPLTATASDLPIPPGGRAIVRADRYVTEAAAILMSGSGTVFVTPGSGSAY
ncbi:MAG TPA: hypothetical protein VF286_00970 [Acidiphilium sp.]